MELVLTLVLVGILSAVAIPRFAVRETFDERGYFEELVSAARYAQKHALSSGCNVQISITATSYQLNRPSGFCVTSDYSGSVLRPNSSDAFSGTAPTGVGLSGVPLTVAFSPDGRANLGAAFVQVDVGAYRFLIHRDTGFVETL